MSDEIDPEVLADLQLRASSERDRTRSRNANYDWTPPPVIDRVPCRARCGNVADWTQEAQDAFETFNRILAQRDEGPLDKTRIVFCDECKAKGATIAGPRNRKHVDIVRDLVEQLKQTEKPRSERILLKNLELQGHPDIPGLLDAIDQKRAKGGKPQTKDVLK